MGSIHHLILFFPNIDVLKRRKNEHKLFLNQNQSTAQSLEVKTRS